MGYIYPALSFLSQRYRYFPSGGSLSYAETDGPGAALEGTFFTARDDYKLNNDDV